MEKRVGDRDRGRKRSGSREIATTVALPMATRQKKICIASKPAAPSDRDRKIIPGPPINTTTVAMTRPFIFLFKEQTS
jgi:hypothetical protein